MPGFGSGAFGGSAFGQYDWSRRVLFLAAPEIYRTADLENNDYFRRYAEAQGVSFDNLRLKIANFADLRDPRAVRSQYDEVRTLRLGNIEVKKGPVEQRGVLAEVTSVSAIKTLRGHFTFADVGKEITTTGSSISSNNRKVIVTDVLNPKEVLTNPPLTMDVGPIRWELRKKGASTTEETLVEVVGGDVEDITPGWILTDGFADFTVLKRQQFKLEADEQKLLTMREGSDGRIDTVGEFTSPSLALTSKDVGRILSIGDTAYPDTNEGRFEIVDVLSSTTCQIDSTDVVLETTGTLFWALLRTPELTLQGSSVLKGTIEQEREDGDILSTGATAVFESISASFSADDVGKLLTLHIPGDTNNGTYEVVGYTSATIIEIEATPGTATGFHWELRAKTDVGDETQVQVRAPSLLKYLAQDFGIEVDNREEEEWQRRWVESVSRWIGLKGHEDGYKYVGALTGFDVEVASLYRVSQEIYLAAAAAGADSYAVGEAGEGRSGTDGSLDLVGSFVQCSSPTAVFENWDVGRAIEVTGSSGGTNDGFRTIIEVVDAQTVKFRAIDFMTGSSDPNNGSLTWRVVRFYSDEPPTLPVHDEINSDLMSYLKSTAVFTVDKYCWEQSPSPWSTLLGPGDAVWRAAQLPPVTGDGRVFITSVDPPGASAFPAVYTLTGRGDFEVAVGLGVGRWKLTDSALNGYFLETVPEFPLISSGGTGELSAPRNFDTSTLLFTVADVGRILIVSGAGLVTQNQAYLIATFNSAKSLTLAAPHNTVVDPNNGSLDWEIRNPDQSGADGSLTGSAPAVFSSPTAAFVTADQGKRLLLVESGSGNNHEYVIETVLSGTSAQLAPYDTPVTPDLNNGTLVWAMFSYEFEVQATVPPNIDAASLEYICPEQMTCSYCRSNKVLVEAITPYLLEKGLERLRDRLEQTKPKHVELVENFGFEVNAGLNLTATVDSP